MKVIDTTAPEDEDLDSIDINEDTYTQAIKNKLGDLIQSRANERRQVTRIMNAYNAKAGALTGDDLEEYLNSMVTRLTTRNRAIENLNAKIANTLPQAKRDADYDRAFDYEEKIMACLQHVETRRKKTPPGTRGSCANGRCTSQSNQIQPQARPQCPSI